MDRQKCTLCGLCIPTCPSDMVRLRGDHVRISWVACIECGHCIAICPTDAIAPADGGGVESRPVAPVPSPESLGDLIRRRRTVRRYRPDPVPREVVESILDAARWVPTAANCQAQEYVVLATAAARDGLRARIEAYYREFAEALADRENRVARFEAMGLDPAAATHPHVLAAVPAFVKSVDSGRDRLFFEAPAVIVVHAARDAVMPGAACAFATLSIVLMAESYGLGTCITGFASDALRNRPEIRESLGIPGGNDVHYVVALGRPDEDFAKVPSRGPTKAQWL